MSEMLEKIAAKMNEKLDGRGLEKSIALTITGEGRVLADADGARISDDPADCEVRMKAGTLEGLVKGKVNPMTAVMLGKIKVSGDMSAAMSLGKLLG